MPTQVPFLEYFQRIEDYRIPGMITYPLDEVLFTVLCGTLCGFEDMDELLMWGESNISWLRKFLPYDNDLPTAKTVRCILSHINSEVFKQSFECWVSSLSSDLKGVVSLDGKSLRNSKQQQNGKGAAHIVRAFAHEMGVVLGQEKVVDKSNEITAIPALLKRLALAGTIVSIDAMGTQKAIVEDIVAAKADYVLSLKGNQHGLHKDVQSLFQDKDTRVAIWDEYEETDAGHGRVEMRNATVTSDISWLRKEHPDWQNLRSVVKIESVRYHKKDTC